MAPATRPPQLRDEVRLLLVDGLRRCVHDGAFSELERLLAPGDLLVVNDAATLPASVHARVELEGRDHIVELRLLGPRADLDSEGGGEGNEDRRWRAIVFGRGDWREDTDTRPEPPALPLGARLRLCGPLTLEAELVSRHPASPRLVELRFDRGGAELYAGLYAAGHPIQYSHLEREEQLWSFQTLFAGRPWAAEMPSAGRPLSAALLARLRARGVQLARLTHAAGISATGDPQLDALLPLPERYELPPETVTAIEQTRARGGRVVAMGTTVVRALESAAREGQLRAGSAETDLVITAETPLRIVDGLVTGMHAPHESHYRLLRAFASEALLSRALDAALDAGYRSHEFGDLALIWRERQDRRSRQGLRTPGPDRAAPLGQDAPA